MWKPTPLIGMSIGLHASAVVAVAAIPSGWPWLGAAIVGNHMVLAGIGLWPRSTLLGPNIVRLSPAARRKGLVALTFDDGPDPDVTPRLLDLLDRHNARASFFFIGRRAAAYPSLVREVIARGHGVENHTERHLMGFACLPPRALWTEIASAQARLADLTGIAPRFFRPPMGIRSPLLDPTLSKIGLRHVSWTTRGFDTTTRDPDRILRRLSGCLACGDILLLHDGRAAGTGLGNPIVLEVVPSLLRRFREAGLRAVSLSDSEVE